MDKHTWLLAAGLAAGSIGCASLQSKAVNPMETNPNSAIPIVDVSNKHPAFSVKTIPPSLTLEQETPVSVIADKLYDQLNTKTKHEQREFTQVEFMDEASGARFTVGIRPCLRKACLTFFLAAPDSDKDYFMAVDEYPLGFLDRASCQNGDLLIDNPIVNRTYEILLRKSYQHIQKVAWADWRLSATITDFELNKAFKNIFDYIHSRD